MPFPSPPSKKTQKVPQHGSAIKQSRKHVVKFEHTNSSKLGSF